MRIRVENGYSDGHESTMEYEVSEISGEDIDALWERLWDYTGDGHGEDSSLGWYYKITILDAALMHLIGQSYENAGN
jgi:hypothetical protein